MDVISKQTQFDYVFLSSEVFIQAEAQITVWQETHSAQLVIMQNDWHTLPSSALYWQIIKPIYKSDIQALTLDTLASPIENSCDNHEHYIQDPTFASEHVVLIVCP